AAQELVIEVCQVKPKKQHWVPRFYLKSFTIDGKGDLAWCFPKKSGDAFKSNIRDIASTKYLYSPENSDGDRSWDTEDKLAGIESTLSKAWNQIAHDFIDLNNDTYRKALSLFMATLVYRNPSMLPVYKKIRTELQESIYSLGFDCNGLPNVTHYVDNNGEVIEIDRSDWNEFNDVSDINNHHFFVDTILKETGFLARLLMRKRWSVIVSDNPVFVTSDTPVTKFNQHCETFGYETKGTVINFPLSPTRCLVLDDLHHEKDGCYYSLNHRGAANSLTWTQCNKYIITGRDPDKVFEEILQLHNGSA
ncbi:DUF4238 domain-containing protein, partial [Vibrio parahaemolyticus]|nr:DUF4238 domain-containing protein [Vibrio parahaemolyticus]